MTPIYRDILGMIAIAYAIFHYGYVIPMTIAFVLGGGAHGL